MKRSPLKRSTKPIQKKRNTPRRSSRVRDPVFLELVRRLACCAAHLDTRMDTRMGTCSPTYKTIEAHHMGRRGLGEKSHDHEAVPLCAAHHRDWHNCTGVFKGRDRAWRAGFAEGVIAQTRDLVTRWRTNLKTEPCRFGRAQGCYEAGVIEPCLPCKVRENESKVPA